MLSVYINEKSLCGQMAPTDWQGCIEGLKECIKTLRTCDTGNVTVLYTPSIYNSPATTDKQSFGTVLDKQRDTKVFIKGFFQKIKRWDISPLTEQGKSYIYRGTDYCYTSVSEAYERLSENTTALVGFSGSVFDIDTIDVDKDNNIRSLHTFNASASLSQFLIENDVLKREYDANSSISPRDCETILSDTTLFTQAANEPLQNSRKVYKRIGHDQLWYVDDAHYGTNAHLEVFSSKTRKQIAVSRVNAIDFFRDLKEGEKGRRI